MPRKPARPTNPTLVKLKRLLRGGEVESQSDAARKLGVSRQRVHQLIKLDGLKAPRGWGHVTIHCSECGKSVTRHRSQHRALKRPDLCASCRAKLGPTLIVLTCKRCGRERRFPAHVARRLTSGLCRSCWARAIPKGRRRRPAIVVECSNCGAKRTYRAALAKVLKTTLCRKCYRRYVSQTARDRRR